jgi:predicted nucleotidyltransferase
MKTKGEILNLLKQELPHLKEMFKVKTIGIFGSYAREEQIETSDIDMLSSSRRRWVLLSS